MNQTYGVKQVIEPLVMIVCDISLLRLAKIRIVSPRKRLWSLHFFVEHPGEKACDIYYWDTFEYYSCLFIPMTQGVSRRVRCK